MKIVIIEFIDEFNAFLLFIDKKSMSLKDFTIVALEPRLQAYLKKHGISYRNTLQYFNNESHKKIILETEKIMLFIHSNFEFVDNNGLKNCYKTELTHYIRLYLNHMLKMLEILENIYRENNECEIFAYVDNRLNPSCMITDNEKYVGTLAENFTRKKNLHFTNFNLNNVSPIAGKQGMKRLETLEKIATIIMLFLMNMNRKNVVFTPRPGNVFSKLISQMLNRDGKFIFLAIDYTDNLSRLIAFNLLSFLTSFIKVYPFNYYLINTSFINATIDKKEQFMLMESINSVINPQTKLLYEYEGVNYYELLQKKIDTGLKGYMSQMLFQSYNLRYLFEKFDKKIVMSYLALGIMAVAGELARKMGIKSLYISHGAHPVPVDLYHEIELLNLCRGFMFCDYTHVILSTPIHEAHLHYFKSKYEWIKNEELKTGPLIFANVNGTDKSIYKIKFGISADYVILTHAVTTKARHGERYYFVETLDEYFSSLSDIVHVVNKNKGVQLIIRIHPGFFLSDDEIKAFLPESDRFIIQREGSFSETLAATDILISYSSTTIDEALMNKIPVLLYDKWDRYNHFQTGIFENSESEDIFPVCYVNKTEKLEEALNFMLGEKMTVKPEDMDLHRYKYTVDYSKNFFRFIRETLNAEGGGK